MKIVVCSDVHLDWVTMGVSRFEEIANALYQTVTAARDNETGEPGLYLFLGDLSNPDSGSAVFRCIEHVLKMAAILSQGGIESHWLAGNHDVIEDGSGHTTLWPLNGIGEGSGLARNVFVHEKPWRMLVPMAKPRFNLIALPYTATSHPYDPADFLKRSFDDRLPNLVIGHMTSIPGVTPGEETREMPRGRETVFPAAVVEQALADGYVVHCFNGHFHRRQSVRTEGGAVIHIPGSLARLTAGEEDHEPSFFELEVS
jgi:DNA repair exonuclease SbcCD nuclease subunit